MLINLIKTVLLYPSPVIGISLIFDSDFPTREESALKRQHRVGVYGTWRVHVEYRAIAIESVTEVGQ